MIEEQFIKALGFNFNSKDQLNGLVLQGGAVKSGEVVAVENRLDAYDDLVICIFNDVRYMFVGTVDPGKYYLENPMSKRGTAHVAFTQHHFVRGQHIGRPALRAKNEEIWIMTDSNLDQKFNELDGMEVAIGSGINIHAGGLETAPVGKWSAGCINVAGGWAGVNWRKFISLVNLSKTNEFSFTVWTAKDFVRFSKNPDQFLPTLSFGYIQKDVKIVQAKLGITPDGIFGKGTALAVIDFQKKNGLVADGVVGTNTWRKIFAA